jgi:hypothetical protein
MATPRILRYQLLSKKLLTLPLLVWKMLHNIVNIDHNNKEFIHTTHDK